MIMRIAHVNLGITLIIVLLALGGIYNTVIGILTMLEYLPTEFAVIASIGSSFTLGIGLFIFVLVYGLAKRKGWALLLSIAFMSFGIISSIMNIIYTGAFEIPSTLGIAGVILFSAAIYYLTRPHVRAVFQ
jgi:hypothetical protein